MARSGVSRSSPSPVPRNRALYTWFRRASMTAQMSMPIWATPQAMDSRVEQAAQGLLPGQASPLAAATPIRTPVKEPGPAATATTSTCSREAPHCSSRAAAMGSRVTEWVRPLSWKDWAIRFSSSHRAAEQATAEDSRARIFTACSPPQW